jgi:hypothetical protein|tara:strand:- start:4273 stop:6246 length:1974 start_codon:yes stop_codon:yes gene_type:complete
MPIKDKFNQASSKIDSYKSTIQTTVNEDKIKKLSDGLDSNISKAKSETLKQLNAMGDIKQRAQQEFQNTFDELTNLLKKSMPSGDKFKNTGSSTMDFLVKQVLMASQNAKSRIGEIITDEVLKVAGCSEEQEFNNQPIYIPVSDIDLKELLKNDPSVKPWSLRYEKNDISVGSQPFSMDRELYNRLQNQGTSFTSEYGNSYPGASGAGLFDLKYVTTYNDPITLTPIFGDFYEVTLSNRLTGNNVGDFLRDYYGSIDLIDFSMVSVEIMNMLTNIIDISGGISVNQKEEQSKFEKIIQRILGLCFDSKKEIDVQGTAKLGQLDNVDQSFFEMAPVDLKNIEIEVNNMIQGVTEFTDCNNVKFPVNTEALLDSMTKLINDDNGNAGDNANNLMSLVNDMSKDQDWKLNLPSGVDLNLNVAINSDFLKIIPKAVMFAILRPKMLLGLQIVMKSVNPNFSNILSFSSLESFIKTFGKFIVNVLSKIAAIFVEELFILLKKNLRLLVETLLIEVVKESKNKQASMIAGVIFMLIQLIKGFIDYRECKSLVDEILKLLNLGAAASGISLPSFALAASSLLGGFSPTRAMTEVTERFQSLGIPTGDLPSGAVNIAMPAIAQQIKGSYQEQLSNGKVEVWIPPLSVPPVVAGSTLPAKASGKSY